MIQHKLTTLLSTTSITYLWVWLAILICVFIVYRFLKNSIVYENGIPNTLQSLCELYYLFIQNHLVYPYIGPSGMRFMPLIATIFTTVVLMNIIGLCPFFPALSTDIFIVSTLAFLMFMCACVNGFRLHGLRLYKAFTPSLLPMMIKPIFFPIELALFFIRPIVLAARLILNMAIGHEISGIFLNLSTSSSYWIIGLCVNTLFMNTLFVIELLASIVQAYVFSLITCLMIKTFEDIH